MPIYVYRCDRCKERFELLVPMSANSATATCPHCGAGEARKTQQVVLSGTVGAEGAAVRWALRREPKEGVRDELAGGRPMANG